MRLGFGAKHCAALTKEAWVGDGVVTACTAVALRGANRVSIGRSAGMGGMALSLSGLRFLGLKCAVDESRPSDWSSDRFSSSAFSVFIHTVPR